MKNNCVLNRCFILVLTRVEKISTDLKGYVIKIKIVCINPLII